MSPVLADAASDLHVSTATAGQLRTITGLAAGVTALGLGAVARARRPRAAAARGLGAPRARLARERRRSEFALLALAQLPVGVAVAVLTTAGTLAAAEWVPPERRTRALSWALVGQPAAWIVGMPLIGLVGEHSWRYGWLALPLAASVARRDLSSRRARGRPPVRSRPARAAPRSPTAGSPAGSCPSCSRTRPGRERSSTPARSSPSRTGPPPG